MKTKMYLFFSAILVSFFITGCGDDSVEPAPFKQSLNFNMDNFNNLNTIVDSPNPHSGKKICRVDSGQNYGFAYIFNVPDSLIGKGITVSIDSWVKTGSKDNSCSVVCSVNNAKDSIMVWQEFEALSVINQPNEWSNLNGTILIPASYMTFNSKINILCFNKSAKSYFEVDDLNVTFAEAQENNP